MARAGATAANIATLPTLHSPGCQRAGVRGVGVLAQSQRCAYGIGIPEPDLVSPCEAGIRSEYERAANGSLEHRRGPSLRQRRASAPDITSLPSFRRRSLA